MRAVTRAAAAMFVLGAVGLAPALALPGVLTGPVNHNGHDYYLLDTSTWADAEAKAVAMGGHLVTLGDQAEQDWVFQTFNAYDGVNRLYWIGLNDQAAEGQFVWANDEPVDFTYWAPGEPNNASNEDFVSMYYLGHGASGRWNDWYDRTHDPIGISFAGVVEIAPPIQWPVAAGGNGHYYEYVPDLRVHWQDANAAAEASTHLGVAGHLATITSQAELDFVAASFDLDADFNQAWLGGWQEPGMAPTEGWHWVTGEPWDFTNWAPGEPNDFNISEIYLGMWGHRIYGGNNPWQWNDDSNNPTIGTYGYFIEYPVPEPASMGLLAVGGAALLRRRRRA